MVYERITDVGLIWQEPALCSPPSINVLPSRIRVEQRGAVGS